MLRTSRSYIMMSMGITMHTLMANRRKSLKILSAASSNHMLPLQNAAYAGKCSFLLLSVATRYLG